MRGARLTNKVVPQSRVVVRGAECFADNALEAAMRQPLAPAAPAAAAAAAAAEAFPDIRADREGWFTYWDRDRAGLTREQLKGALHATFAAFHGGDARKLATMDEAVDMTWMCFDLREDGRCSRREFNTPNSGLGDTLLASFRHEATAHDADPTGPAMPSGSVPPKQQRLGAAYGAARPKKRLPWKQDPRVDPTSRFFPMPNVDHLIYAEEV